jgi:predicted transcriptional regulator of viral defense system
MLQYVNTCVNLLTKRNNAMKTTLTQKVLAIARARQIIRPRDLEALGIPREYVLRLMRKGILRRLGRGVYELAELSPTEHHSLAVAAKEMPHGVVCLLSALRFHELTTQNPSEVWIGIHVEARQPRNSSVRHRIVRYSERTLKSGARIHKIEGVPVKIFRPAKTVADCFKYRNKIGLDVAIEALQDSLKQRKATVDEIVRYAKICRVARVIQPYLEALYYPTAFR